MKMSLVKYLAVVFTLVISASGMAQNSPPPIVPPDGLREKILRLEIPFSEAADEIRDEAVGFVKAGGGDILFGWLPETLPNSPGRGVVYNSLYIGNEYNIRNISIPVKVILFANHQFDRDKIQPRRGWSDERTVISFSNTVLFALGYLNVDMDPDKRLIYEKPDAWLQLKLEAELAVRTDPVELQALTDALMLVREDQAAASSKDLTESDPGLPGDVRTPVAPPLPLQKPSVKEKQITSENSSSHPVIIAAFAALLAGVCFILIRRNYHSR